MTFLCPTFLKIELIPLFRYTLMPADWLYGLRKVTSALVMIFQSDALVDMDAEKRRQMETVFVL